MKHSDYKVGCDDHKHCSLFAVFDSLCRSFERIHIDHERGATRTEPPGWMLQYEEVTAAEQPNCSEHSRVRHAL